MGVIMKNKALLLADLHLHHLPNWRLDWCAEFVDYLLNSFGKPDEACDLYILGDVIEIRDKVDSRILNILIKLIKNWGSGDVVWLSGQHDSYLPGKATLHELNGFKLEKGQVFVVDNEVLNHKGNYFIPFQRRDEDYRKCLKQIPNDSIVLTHLPTKEIIEMYGAKDFEGISVKEFDRFKHTISGDIHKFYDFPKFSYVGAPSQRDWRDKGVDGQIATLEDGKFTRIPTTHPKHIEVADSKEIPTEGEYIVKTKRGTKIKAENVISVVETADLNIDTVELTVSGSMADQIDGYMKLHKPPAQAKDAKEYAEQLLEE